MSKPNIIFSGASGVGKSTLMGWAADEFRVDAIPSVNSQVYKEAGVTFEQALLRPEVIRQCQREIYTRVTRNLKYALNEGHGLVTDRGMDLTVYTADMLGGWEFYKDWGIAELEALVKRDDVLVFFVRPNKSVLEVARKNDGGRRAEFLSDEVVRRMDGATEMLLEDRGVRHFTIDSPRMKDRCRLVREVVKLWSKAHDSPVAADRRGGNYEAAV